MHLWPVKCHRPVWFPATLSYTCCRFPQRVCFGGGGDSIWPIDQLCDPCGALHPQPQEFLGSLCQLWFGHVVSLEGCIFPYTELFLIKPPGPSLVFQSLDSIPNQPLSLAFTLSRPHSSLTSREFFSNTRMIGMDSGNRKTWVLIQLYSLFFAIMSYNYFSPHPRPCLHHYLGLRCSLSLNPTHLLRSSTNTTCSPSQQLSEISSSGLSQPHLLAIFHILVLMVPRAFSLLYFYLDSLS